MEELQCALLGKCGYVLKSTPSPIPDSVRERLHPTEAAIATSAAAVGTLFSSLDSFSRDVFTGRTSGAYKCAFAVALRSILRDYEDAACKVEKPLDLLQLQNKYRSVFEALSALCKEDSVDKMHRKAWEFVSSCDYALPYRTLLGREYVMTALFLMAHWVAHGALLSAGGNDDFFVTLRASPSPPTYVVDARKIACRISPELAATILVAGRERATLKEETELESSHLTPLAFAPSGGASPSVEAAGVSPERTKMRVAAENDRRAHEALALTIFRSIYDDALCDEGQLRTDELEARIEAARLQWSRALWTIVNRTSALSQHLAAIRDVYLCRRGDMWHSFIEHSFSTVCTPSSTTSLLDRRDPARIVADAFRTAMSSVGLIDNVCFDNIFRISMDSGVDVVATRDAEEMGRVLLHRTKRIRLQYSMPAGIHLVVSPASVEMYQRLFSYHISLQYAQEALMVCRRFVNESARSLSARGGAATKSSALLLHILSFLLSTTSQFLQLDVQEAHFAVLSKRLLQADSVQVAQRAHEEFIAAMLDGAFLSSKYNDVALQMDAIIALSFSLYAAVLRFESSSAEVSSSYAELANAAQFIEKRLLAEVLPSLSVLLSVSLKKEHRALWTRLDFNRFLSSLQSPAARPQSKAPVAATRILRKAK